MCSLRALRMNWLRTCGQALWETIWRMPLPRKEHCSTRFPVDLVKAVWEADSLVLRIQRQLYTSCDIFHLYTGVNCYGVNIARACTSAEPLSLKAKQCFHISHHIGLHRSAHCALNPHKGIAEGAGLRVSPERPILQQLLASSPHASFRDPLVLPRTMALYPLWAYDRAQMSL